MKTKLKFIVPRPADRPRRRLQVRARQAGARRRSRRSTARSTCCRRSSWSTSPTAASRSSTSALVLDHTQRGRRRPARRRAKPPEGFGTLPQEAVVRDIVTDALTDDNADEPRSSAERPREAQEADPQGDQEEDRREGRGGPVHRRRGPVGDPMDPLSPSSRTITRRRLETSTPSAPTAAGSAARARPRATRTSRRLHDVPVELAVEIGRTRMTIGETLALGPGRSSRSTAWPASPSTCWSTARRSPAARSS